MEWEDIKQGFGLSVLDSLGDRVLFGGCVLMAFDVVIRWLVCVSDFFQHGSVMAVVFIKIEYEFYLFFHLVRGRAEPMAAAQFAFE